MPVFRWNMLSSMKVFAGCTSGVANCAICSAGHGTRRFGSRGNREHSRILSTPIASIVMRSRPSPAPACGAAPAAEHTSAYVSIRQHTSAYVSIAPAWGAAPAAEHTSAYVSIRQHTSAYVSICQHTSAYVSACVGRSTCRRAGNQSTYTPYICPLTPHTATSISGNPGSRLSIFRTNTEY